MFFRRSSLFEIRKIHVKKNSKCEEALQCRAMHIQLPKSLLLKFLLHWLIFLHAYECIIFIFTFHLFNFNEVKYVRVSQIQYLNAFLLIDAITFLLFIFILVCLIFCLVFYPQRMGWPNGAVVREAGCCTRSSGFESRVRHGCRAVRPWLHQ